MRRVRWGRVGVTQQTPAGPVGTAAHSEEQNNHTDCLKAVLENTSVVDL